MERNDNFVRLGENNRAGQVGKIKILGILMPVLQVCVVIGIQVVIYSVVKLPLEIGFCVIGCYMIISIVLLLVYFVWQRVHGENICEEGQHHHSNAHLLIGLYIFGIGTLLYAMMQIAGVMECTLHYYEVVYPSAVLLFAISQMLCLHAFINKAMKYHWLLVISWHFLIGTNISSYITNTVLELHLISSSQNGTNHTKCDGAILYEFGAVWRESLVSFVSEFNIISAGIIGTIIYNIAAIGEVDENEDNGNDGQNQVENTQNLFYRSQPGITFGIFSSVLTVTYTICVLYDEKIIIISYSILIAKLLVIIFVLTLMQRFIHNYEIELTVRTDDILLYITVVGILVEYFAFLYSSAHFIHNGEKMIIAWCTLFIALLGIGAAIFQVFVLVQYLHLKRRINSIWSKQFLYFILLENLTSWTIDTFLFLKKNTAFGEMYPTLDYIDKDYAKVASVANVFDIFFHFHSAVLAYEITSTKLT